MNQATIDKMNSDLKTISISCIVFVILFGYVFHKYAVKHEMWLLSIFVVTIVPIAAIVYNIYYNTTVYRSSHSKKHELKEIKSEIRAESKFYEIIAFLLFGLGLIYAEFKKYKYFKKFLNIKLKYKLL